MEVDDQLNSPSAFSSRVDAHRTYWMRGWVDFKAGINVMAAKFLTVPLNGDTLSASCLLPTLKYLPPPPPDILGCSEYGSEE
jgi:hypothetical protein